MLSRPPSCQLGGSDFCHLVELFCIARPGVALNETYPTSSQNDALSSVHPPRFPQSQHLPHRVLTGKEGILQVGEWKKLTPILQISQNRGYDVGVRLEEGNFKGAIRLITSTDKPAPPTPAVLQSLSSKHPSAPTDRRTLPLPLPLHTQTQFDEAAVRKAIISFPASSTGLIRVSQCP